MPRPRKYATDAERQAAYRTRNKTEMAAIRLPARSMATVEKLAEQFGVSRSDMVNNLVAFALANRQWARVGLYTKPLPPAAA